MRSPLSRKPLVRFGLALVRVIRAAFRLASLIPFVSIVSCSRSQGNRFVDTRLDANSYFIQEVHRAHLSNKDTEANRRRLCHEVRLTLNAGYDHYVTVPSGRSPDVPLRDGEEVVTTTIKMFKGPPPPGDHHAMDAHLIEQACR
ncbi:MAG: hypothetical protein ACRD1B_00410 [Thermoanaerobaculia bacterium]